MLSIKLIAKIRHAAKNYPVCQSLHATYYGMISAPVKPNMKIRITRGVQIFNWPHKTFTENTLCMILPKPSSSP